MIWAGLAGYAAVVVAAVYAYTRWARASWDDHTESALRLARDRHPVNRRPCSCGRVALQPGRTAYSHDGGEPMMHALSVCIPTRELL